MCGEEGRFLSRNREQKLQHPLPTVDVGAAKRKKKNLTTSASWHFSRAASSVVRARAPPVGRRSTMKTTRTALAGCYAQRTTK